MKTESDFNKINKQTKTQKSDKVKLGIIKSYVKASLEGFVEQKK